MGGQSRVHMGEEEQAFIISVAVRRAHWSTSKASSMHVTGLAV